MLPQICVQVSYSWSRNCIPVLICWSLIPKVSFWLDKLTRNSIMTDMRDNVAFSPDSCNGLEFSRCTKLDSRYDCEETGSGDLYSVDFGAGRLVKKHIDHLIQRSEPSEMTTPLPSPKADTTITNNFQYSEELSTPPDQPVIPDPARQPLCRYPQREHHSPDRYSATWGTICLYREGNVVTD